MNCEKLKTLRKARNMTLDELARLVGTSKQTVQRYEKGVIANVPPEKVEALAKALGVAPSELMGWESDFGYANLDNIYPLSTRKLPILGKIACGKPIYAEQEYESFAAVNCQTDADFCLRAQGDSMTGARIYDGDLVFIRSQDEVDRSRGRSPATKPPSSACTTTPKRKNLYFRLRIRSTNRSFTSERNSPRSRSSAKPWRSKAL
ncbi:MAG: helix-turn-helix domain-containing protein [Clostridia bacterium]|nr:helix-turn-helix domain-containing protein [Clostridia bacterium]